MRFNFKLEMKKGNRKPKIFEQEQIARAVELGLGASSPEQIRLAAADEATQGFQSKIEEILRQG